MANQLNAGGKERAQELISSLKVGQTLLTKVIRTSNPNLVRAELVERIAKKSNNSKSTDEGIISMYEMSMGASSSLQYFWSPVDSDHVETWLNIDELDLRGVEFTTEYDSKGVAREVYYLNVTQPTAYVNPTTGEAVEYRIRGRIIETVEGKEWDMDNGKYKINPSTKDAVLHNGQYIYYKNTFTFTENLDDNFKGVPHVYLASDVVSVTSKVEKEAAITMDMM